MAISIDYNLTGRGWSECIIEINDQQAHWTASYLSDALANLLNAVVIVVRGAEEATVSFIEEPGEYRWRLKRGAQDKLCISIVWFEEISRDRPDECGKIILEAQCRMRTFAGVVLSASQRVLATHGLEGYREKWVKHEFPVSLQAKLQDTLDWNCICNLLMLDTKSDRTKGNKSMNQQLTLLEIDYSPPFLRGVGGIDHAKPQK